MFKKVLLTLIFLVSVYISSKIKVMFNIPWYMDIVYKFSYLASVLSFIPIFRDLIKSKKVK